MRTTAPAKPEIRNHDLLALRNFITAHDHQHPNQTAATTAPPQTNSLVLLDITHSNLHQQHLEVRFFYSHTLLEDICDKIYQTTGTPACDQHLQLYSSTNQLVCDPLQSVALIYSGCRVHCIDTNEWSASARGALENVALVKKFRMNDDDYDQRPNTLRSWARLQKQVNPDFTFASHAAAKRRTNVTAYATTAAKQDVTVTDYTAASVAHCTLGSRCELTPGQRRGVVSWTGQLDTAKGYWVGVRLDEPVGQNDGTLQGVSYFCCEAGCGAFARGPNVAVGEEFVERDLWGESDSEEEL
jgi:tubulin-folding cofactor B